MSAPNGFIHELARIRLIDYFLSPGIISGVQHATAHNIDLPVFCGDSFRQKVTDAHGRVTYWDPIWQVYDSDPTCEDDPSFAYVMRKYKGHPNTPERLVYCKDYLDKALSKMTLSQYKLALHHLYGVSIDVPRETPAGVGFHEMTHTRYAGSRMYQYPRFVVGDIELC